MLKCLFLRFNRQVELIDKSHCSLHAVPDDVVRHHRSLEELCLNANQIKTLPEFLFRLGNLQRLDLSDNEISAIPPEISRLSSLVDLNVGRNEIVDIPESICLCQQLVYLDLSNNPLSRLPDNLPKLESLEVLISNDVSLLKIPPNIGGLPSLRILELRDNLITFVPESLSFLSMLERLDLGCNEIDSLPPSFGCLQHLLELMLDSNLICSLPMELSQLSNLAYLDLSDNHIAFLPNTIGELTSLTDLILNQNKLQELPESIGLLQSLGVLRLDSNHLLALPESIGELANLTELTLTDNSLENLPSSIGKLQKLQLLNIDRNNITTLPVEICCCLSLTVLQLRENCISELPKQLGDLVSLQVLDLVANRIEHLPLSLSRIKLRALWLSENQSNGLVKLQVDVLDTGEQVLTCVLLPQSSRTHAADELANVNPNNNIGFNNPNMAYSDEDQDNEDLHKVHFAGDISEKESHLVRQNTPRPKDLRTRHHKLLVHRKDDDWRKDSRSSTGSDTSYAMDTSLPRLEQSPYAFSEGTPFPPQETPKRSGMSHNQVSVQLADSHSEKSSSESEFDENSNAEGADERHVNFAEVETEADRTSRLKRKNTPHYLKGKRIQHSPGSAMENRITSVEEDDDHMVDARRPSECGDPSESILERTFVIDNESKAASYHPSGEVFYPTHGGHPILPTRPGSQICTVTKYFEEIQCSLLKVNNSLGFHIASGGSTELFPGQTEGFVVSKLVPGGPATLSAVIQVGDRLTKVQDICTDGLSHDEVVQLLRSCVSPVTLCFVREITNPMLQSIAHNVNATFLESTEIEEQTVLYQEIHVTVTRSPKGLGFSIVGGSNSSAVKYLGPGIFIAKVVENGPAFGKVELGDRIVKINGVDVSRAAHDEAVKMLSLDAASHDLVLLRETITSVIKGANSPSAVNGIAGITPPFTPPPSLPLPQTIALHNGSSSPTNHVVNCTDASVPSCFPVNGCTEVFPSVDAAVSIPDEGRSGSRSE